MKQCINIRGETNFQMVVIASAAMHILFIALMSVQTGTNDRKMQRYYVSLVPPPVTEARTETKAADSKPKKPQSVVKAVPAKKDRGAMMKLTKAVPQEKKSVSSADRQKERPLVKIRQSDELIATTINKIGIKRDVQKPTEYKARYKGGDNKAGREAFAPGEGSQDITPLIARKKNDALPRTGPIERVSSVPAFLARNSHQKQGGMIARTNRMEKRSAIEPEKIKRVPEYSDKKVIHEQSYIVARQNAPESAKPLRSSGNFEYPDRDVIGDVEIGASGGAIEQEHISRPDTLNKTKEKDSVYNKKGGQIIRDAVLKRVNEVNGSDKLPASEFSIQGVPLDDLTACKKALDEGMLKKKILKVVGENKSCYSPASGKYVFLETGRFTSFDMMISPVSGRVLSDRCEELRNALTCLITIKEK